MSARFQTGFIDPNFCENLHQFFKLCKCFIVLQFIISLLSLNIYILYRVSNWQKGFQIICLKKIFKNYLDSYESYICKKITVFHVDKLSICYLLHPVIHKHDSNNICTNPFPHTFSPLPYLVHDLSSLFCLKCTLYSVHFK